MTISLIVAAAENNVIGDTRKNDMLWHLPADFKHFRDTTKGHPIIMGRKTYESIGKPLPDRQNIVITRQEGFAVEGCEVVPSLEDALDVATGEEVFIIGGGQIYEQALPQADRVYLTRVHESFEGDVTFPELSPDEWKQVSSERHEADDKNPHAYTFELYEAKAAESRESGRLSNLIKML